LTRRGGAAGGRLRAGRGAGGDFVGAGVLVSARVRVAPGVGSGLIVCEGGAEVGGVCPAGGDFAPRTSSQSTGAAAAAQGVAAKTRDPSNVAEQILSSLIRGPADDLAIDMRIRGSSYHDFGQRFIAQEQRSVPCNFARPLRIAAIADAS
jgi:hypothetical protein